MSRHTPRPIVRRLALINPTKFLGNLLLAGELIQHLNVWCQRERISLLLVLDASFRELMHDSFPGAEIVYYPRQALRGAVPDLQGVRLWWQCVRQIRKFRADLAFTVEEDSVSHRLTHFSGARYKVSSTPARYQFGFDEVLDVQRTQRPFGQESIWYSFAEVLQRLDLPVPSHPDYLKLGLPAPDDACLALLRDAGLMSDRPYAVLHAGASKIYKQWPVEHFTELTQLLLTRGYQVVLIGAGARDQQVNQEIHRRVASTGMTPAADADPTAPTCVDLCNRLSLRELAQVLRMATLMVGNDSGPSHLASSLGLPGVVIFGPTDIPIWRPLGHQTTVLDNKALCDVTCTRHRCPTGYFCLRSVAPRDVMNALFPTG